MNNLFQAFIESTLNGIFVIRQLAIVVYELSLVYVDRVSNFVTNGFFIEANEYLEKWGRLFGISRNRSSREEHVFEKTFEVAVGSTVTGDNNKVYTVTAITDETITVSPLDDEVTEGLTRINDRQSQSFSEVIVSTSPYIPIERLDAWRDRIKLNVFRQVEDSEGAIGEVLDVWDGISDTEGKWLVRSLPQNYLYYYDDDPDISQIHLNQTDYSTFGAPAPYEDDAFRTRRIPLRAGYIHTSIHAIGGSRLTEDQYAELVRQIRAINNKIIPIINVPPSFNPSGGFPAELFMQEMNRIEAGYKRYYIRDYQEKFFITQGSFPQPSRWPYRAYRLVEEHPVNFGVDLQDGIILMNNYVVNYEFTIDLPIFRPPGDFYILVRPDIIYA